ncbi:hypothetical protein MBAV_002336 [Candidatus Magnetobacterium bavaricum]|uniref:Uncharacterized protein n=1 Tax=Candidatus Magnetobacterium bavaricum TaxID=29290 RepID=A0A0F3GUE3_9BACT|nr:hypothetical protein MBAV_002336 [Candidatus Magnetobacterium bavaricum]
MYRTQSKRSVYCKSGRGIVFIPCSCRRLWNPFHTVWSLFHILCYKPNAQLLCFRHFPFLKLMAWNLIYKTPAIKL